MLLEPSMKQEQKLSLSYRQTLSLQVLAMNTSELNDYIEEQQLENPILEVQKEHESYEELAAIGQYFQSAAFDEKQNTFEDEEEYQQELPYSDVEPLKDYVISQLKPGACSDSDLPVLTFLIDSLDDHGYLPLSAEQTANLTGASAEQAARMIELLQSLEPVGIGARDLKHCLSLQAEARNAAPEVFSLIDNDLEDISHGYYQRISKDLGISVKKIKECVLFIQTLNPIPINGFSRGHVEYIVPDVIFTCQDGEWNVEVNDRWVGSIGISSLYIEMAKAVDDPELKKYFSQKIDAARFVLQCVEQRRHTLEQVSRYILEYQLGFFQGTQPLRPLTMRQIADALSIHESTVSRTLRTKFAATPRGTFPLKSCLDDSLSRTDGQTKHGRSETMEALSAMIQKEDPAHPYSDSTLSAMLENAGYPVSRRTVTKYREILGISNAFARKYQTN